MFWPFQSLYLEAKKVLHPQITQITQSPTFQEVTVEMRAKIALFMANDDCKGTARHGPAMTINAVELDCLYYISCLDALGAYGYLPSLAAYYSLDLLKVWQPTPLGVIVCMTDITPHYRTFTTYIATPCHDFLCSFFVCCDMQFFSGASIPYKQTDFKDRPDIFSRIFLLP